jgi:hypothetical protein
MYCDCTSYHAQSCVADAYHIPIEQAMQRYLPCPCDCHEDEAGRPVTEHEWDERQAFSTRLFRSAPINVHPLLHKLQTMTSIESLASAPD